MMFFIGLIFVLLGGTGVWRYDGRSKPLTLISMLILGIGFYHVTAVFSEALGGS